MKLAIASALLLGACVTTDTDEVAKVAPIDHVDYGTMVLTSVQSSSGSELVDSPIDWPTELALDPSSWSELCASAATLQGSDVCSSLCDPQDFVARINDTNQQNPETCTQHPCLVGDKLLNIEVCAPGNN